MRSDQRMANEPSTSQADWMAAELWIGGGALALDSAASAGNGGSAIHAVLPGIGELAPPGQVRRSPGGCSALAEDERHHDSERRACCRDYF